MTPKSIKFGTSGLRGLAIELNGAPAFAFTRAFAEMLKEGGMVSASQGRVLVGRDLRESSPQISQLCCVALGESGLVPLDCGALPTPALAYEGIRLGLPAIMVTGSHIPEDRNGLKFYRADGEIDKNDETRILAWHDRLKIHVVPDVPARAVAKPEGEPLTTYKARYLDFFRQGLLSGLTVGVYQHSSVARDVISDIVEALGARAVPLGRAPNFIPVDTEALREEDQVLARQWASEQRLDAIVSTDGDADRPLIADSMGTFLRGDLVGALTARYLGADTIVTPITSNSALEKSGAFKKVIRTRVGSPYVIEAIVASRSDGHIVVGFEANGGVLLGTDIAHGDRRLLALPTRDALLPILCVLAEIAEKGKSLEAICSEFGFKAAASNRLENIATDKSSVFMSRLQNDGAFLADLFAEFQGVSLMDAIDGVRILTNSGEVVHFRPSGNAPELRVYAEAFTQDRAEFLLNWGLKVAGHHVR